MCEPTASIHPQSQRCRIQMSDLEKFGCVALVQIHFLWFCSLTQLNICDHLMQIRVFKLRQAVQRSELSTIMPPRLHLDLHSAQKPQKANGFLIDFLMSVFFCRRERRGLPSPRGRGLGQPRCPGKWRPVLKSTMD